MRLTFVELPAFTQVVHAIADDETLRAWQNELLRRPDKGDLIPRLHGLRKVRLQLAGRGRQGGARVIYLYLPDRAVLILFYLYTKSQSENLSPDQERRLRVAVDVIKQHYRHENESH